MIEDEKFAEHVLDMSLDFISSWISFRRRQFITLALDSEMAFDPSAPYSSMMDNVLLKLLFGVSNLKVRVSL